MKLACTVLNIFYWGWNDNFFNMIYRVLIKFNQNLSKNQDFKEHMLLTFNVLIIIKDQLNTIDFGITFGIGFEFDNNFGLGLRVIQGLSNINKESDAKDHNFVVALRGTYTFKK